MQDFEGLGTFYLGAKHDLDRRERTAELAMYDSKDLVTHAVVVGMTGSGKTGLGVVLLEEAALDGIPALVIDPKGDLANLLLTFPELRPADFAPWIDPDDARTKGLGVDELAERTAAKWKSGLAEWGQDGARVQRLREAVEFAVYTPGSSAGRQIGIVESFAAPDADTLEDAELFGERVSTTVSSLLGLAGVDADPVQSREHILLSTIVQRAWAAGRNLDLGGLISEVQKPGVDKIGVLDLESFYPAKERFALALALNNLLASPGFAAWMQGEPLDIDSLLYTPEGKPRVAIFSIAHLSDAQRMFFVSLLLNQTLGWVRRQRGTSSLRALVYMDEIAGYFPPVANPPSKAPLLTLMKQARAFGVGVVLATQNPVDLDYKGLANAGTWFIGRLQTERDKARLIEGLEGALSTAGAPFDRGAMERTLASLSARVFLMNNVHDDRPTIFETRWALSYLRGPMTRAELKRLNERESAARALIPSPAPSPNARATAHATPTASTRDETTTATHLSAQRPVLPADVPQYFLPLRAGAARVEYRPMLFASARVAFADAKLGVDEQRTVSMLTSCRVGPVAVDWDGARALECDEGDLEHAAVDGATFAALPGDCAKAKSYDVWRRAFADHLFRSAQLDLLRSETFGLVSTPGEAERDFKLRVAQYAREQRDLAIEKLRAKYAVKLNTLEERRRKREQTLAVQKEQASGAKVSTALSFGSALLSALMGGKTKSVGNVGRAASAARGVSRSMKESSDVDRAAEDLASVEAELRALQTQIEDDLAAKAAEFDLTADTLSKRSLKPKKSAISVRAVVLAWAPHDADSGAELWT